MSFNANVILTRRICLQFSTGDYIKKKYIYIKDKREQKKNPIEYNNQKHKRILKINELPFYFIDIYIYLFIFSLSNHTL